jgi:tRNA(fMet)-specific endonuclease VapC
VSLAAGSEEKASSVDTGGGRRDAHFRPPHRPGRSLTCGYLLDTNILSALIRDPRGVVLERIRRVGEASVLTSIVVAAELRYGAAKKASPRLLAQLEAVLEVLEVAPLDAPADAIYRDGAAPAATRVLAFCREWLGAAGPGASPTCGTSASADFARCVADPIASVLAVAGFHLLDDHRDGARVHLGLLHEHGRSLDVVGVDRIEEVFDPSEGGKLLQYEGRSRV